MCTCTTCWWYSTKNEHKFLPSPFVSDDQKKVFGRFATNFDLKWDFMTRWGKGNLMCGSWSKQTGKRFVNYPINETRTTHDLPPQKKNVWLGLHQIMLKLTWNCLRCGLRHLLAGITSTFIIWIDEGLALCLAPMSRSGEREGPRSCTKIMKIFYHVQTNMAERSLLWPTHKTYHSMVIRPGVWLVEGHVTSLATVLTA